MKTQSFSREEVRALLPLLRSIAREIEERSSLLERIEARLEEPEPQSPAETREFVAQAACHRRQLRLVHRELERLGCSVVGTTPLTLRIPGHVGGTDRSFVWQRGNPQLH